MHINNLSDDLLAAIMAAMADSTQLRMAAGTCRRWAGVLRERLDLWSDVTLALPPKRSRGRDRRNSYTTPCALNLERLAAWLAWRRGAISSMEVALLYPDAVPLLASLLPPLAQGLRRLSLRGNCADWPFFWVDWRWLGGMTQLESLEMWDALPGMAELVLPPSLTELIIDRVGEADPDTEGWDELPEGFARMTALRRLTLGTAATYLRQAEEESAFTPLRAAASLQELRLPNGALSAVPDALTTLSALTLLSFRGCSRLEAFGDMCHHKPDAFQPLRAMTQLRSLDFARCALEQLPPGLGCLPELRTLLLSDNQLTTLPAHAPMGHVPALARRGALRALARAPLPPGLPVGVQQQPQPAAQPAGTLPSALETLDLAGNRFTSLPAAALAQSSGLRVLDLSCCWQLQPTGDEWRSFCASLPSLTVLRHSCALLAAEAQHFSWSGAMDAHMDARPSPGPGVRLEYISASRHRHAGSPARATAGISSAGVAVSSDSLASGASQGRARSCGSLLELEAAGALLGAGRHATLAELAATASSSQAAS